MRCDEALPVLVGIEAGGQPPEEQWGPLRDLDLVAVSGAGGGDLAEIEGRKSALRALLARRAEGGPDPALDAEIRRARLEALDLAERAPSPTGMELTFRGRDLLGELATRPRRHGAEVADFLTEMNRLRARLLKRAGDAAALLAQVSPDRQDVDEVHLRAMSLGLADTPNAATVVLDALNAPPAGVPPAMLAPLLEAVLLNPESTTAQECLGLSGRIPCARPEDALWAAMILLPLSPRSQDRAIAELPAMARLTGDTLAAALLLRAADAGEGAEWDATIDAVRRVAPGLGQAPLAAAFLVIAPGSPARATARFGELFEGVSRLVDEPAVAVPVAMLTMLDLPTPELLDDLRLAGAAVQTAGLSLGPAENVGLAVKLLLHVALDRGRPGDAGPDLALTLPAPRRFPAAMQAVSTFLGVNRYALRPRVHRLHTHTGYG